MTLTCSELAKQEEIDLAGKGPGDDDVGVLVASTNASSNLTVKTENTNVKEMQNSNKPRRRRGKKPSAVKTEETETKIPQFVKGANATSTSVVKREPEDIDCQINASNASNISALSPVAVKTEETEMETSQSPILVLSTRTKASILSILPPANDGVHVGVSLHRIKQKCLGFVDECNENGLSKDLERRHVLEENMRRHIEIVDRTSAKGHRERRYFLRGADAKPANEKASTGMKPLSAEGDATKDRSTKPAAQKQKKRWRKHPTSKKQKKNHWRK